MNTVIVDTTANTTAHGNGITVEANLALTTDKDTISNISYTVNSDAVDMLETFARLPSYANGSVNTITF